MTTDEAREFFKFLNGEVPWNGTWFGEYAPGERGAYWWRKHLDEAIAALIAAPAAPQQAEPVGDFLLLDQAMSDENVRKVSAFAQANRDEVQRLREAARAYIEAYFADDGERMATFYAKKNALEALRRALEGGE